MKIFACPHKPVLEPCGLKNLDYQIDTYIGCEHYCYYCYALEQAETDWTREILVHEDITGQLEEELSGITPRTIYLGYKTDPYQPCESEYKQTRQVLELLLEKGFSASILTKSDLVLRDMDILREMDSSSISVSVAFNDNSIRKLFEYNTVDTEKRIGALMKMREAGIGTSALICPVIPFITEVKPLIDMLAPYTDVIWIYGLSIRERTARSWRNTEAILKQHFPDLKERIDEVIFSDEHPYWKKLRRELEELASERNINLNIRL